ncbi:hypothetical protein GBF38_011421 [Nibea albiflora]|uniref:Uncharacterized protein n=1 Tax=Nibea albiflora TaxID=240163 RepID=A0ACB7F4B6_NIBAL|nr:hypothetical protein GBF38_011421 [Nibea albiflora]
MFALNLLLKDLEVPSTSSSERGMVQFLQEVMPSQAWDWLKMQLHLCGVDRCHCGFFTEDATSLMFGNLFIFVFSVHTQSLGGAVRRRLLTVLPASRGRPRGSQNAGCLSPIPRPCGARSYVPESDSEPGAGDPQVGTRLASEEEAMDSDHSEEF